MGLSETAASDRRDATGTQCIRRTFSIIRLLAGGRPEGEKLVDIAGQLSLSHPTAHRILKALADEGIVERTDNAQRYRLGAEAAWLGVGPFHRFPIARLAAKALDDLAHIVGDTVLLSVPSQNDVVVVDRRFGAWPVQARLILPGTRRPMGVTLGGRTIMAYFSEERVATILRENSERYLKWNCSEAMIRCGIEEIRSKGFALDDSLLSREHRVVAVPVRDVVGRAIASLSVVAPKSRLNPERLARIVPALRNAAREVADAQHRQRVAS